MSQLPLLFGGFTYSLKTQGQDIWISELSLSIDGFTYCLKTQEQDIWISELPCQLMHSLTS